jgi:DNA-binding NarL/FixJ family response regulator
VQKAEAMADSPLIRVLLVDDEPLARAMMREMLQSDPQVEIVGESVNGREALEAIHALCSRPSFSRRSNA